MDKLEREALQVTKEIVVKFIETQRISPGNIKEVFPSVYRVILDTIRDGHTPDADGTDED